jgi:hypothetical protein
VFELYKRLARGCTTINQLNRVHIALERRLTPLNVMRLRSELAAQPKSGWLALKVERLLNAADSDNKIVRVLAPLAGSNTLETSRAWIDKLHLKLRLSGDARPQPFVRRRLDKGLSLFECRADRSQKTLLIGFSGDAARLMMPTSMFLQHLDARTTDFVLLYTEKRLGYRNGVRGIAGDLEASAAALENLLDSRAYGRVATIGASSGALPAILVGFRMGADATLSIGPNDPNNVRWSQFTKDRGVTDLFRHFAGANSRLPDVHLVYGADEPRDAAAVQAIASRIQVRSIRSVPDAKHNVLFPLAEREQLRDLLRSTVTEPPATSTEPVSLETVRQA